MHDSRRARETYWLPAVDSARAVVFLRELARSLRCIEPHDWTDEAAGCDRIADLLQSMSQLMAEVTCQYAELKSRG